MGKREYRDRYYLVIGLVIGGSLSILASFVAGSYFASHPQPDETLFWIALGSFLAVWVTGLVAILHLEKKIK